MDKLDKIFELRRDFISVLSESIPGSYPELPADLSKKSNQQFCRDLALRGVEELIEAVQELKNSKSHRQTEIKEFDRSAFLEEIVDSLNFIFSLVIVSGFTEDDLFSAYVKKDKILHDRLDNGY
jgi:predicted house-cleaning noncanonical NTP pyrophosphatase (MazG superfamily)